MIDERGADAPLPPVEALNAEWDRQVQRLVDLGFHEELGMSEGEYRASLPKFEPQPEAFKGRFDIPVLVETRIGPKRQCMLAVIGYLYDFAGHGLQPTDWPGDPRGYRTPDVPYVAWMQDGSRNKDKSVSRIRSELSEDERGATVLDGIALVIAHSGVLRNRNRLIGLPGSEIESDSSPCLSLGVRPYDVVMQEEGVEDAESEPATCGRN